MLQTRTVLRITKTHFNMLPLMNVFIWETATSLFTILFFFKFGCHWTIDHLLLFSQANMSWWWVSSRPSLRSQSSVQWRWQTSPSVLRFTGRCGSWRWRTCSRRWPECRAVDGNAALFSPRGRTACVCHTSHTGWAEVILDKWRNHH